MKTIYRTLAFGLLTMALTAVTATSLFAQDAACADVEAKQAVYKKFTDNYASKENSQRQTAIDAANEYVQKYGSCAEDKDIITYLNKSVPTLQAAIKAKAAQDVKDQENALFNRFDAAIKSEKTAEIYSVGKEILAKKPDFVDVTIVLATAGFNEASAKPPVDTYNGEAVNYAKNAIQQIESGAKSATGDYGVLGYSYKLKDNKAFSTTEGARTNALGWMNYIIGYIDFYRLNKKDEGLAYLYKSSMADSTTKTSPVVYQTIAAHYRDDVVRLGDEIVTNLKANNNQANDETKALIAMQKGYADRAADAYARAYNVADKGAAGKSYRDGLYNSLKEIYTLRYEGKKTDVDAFANSVASRPMPDPATKVDPIAEDDETTATTSGTTTSPMTTTNTNTNTNTAKPAATKPAATPVKPATMDTKKPPTTPMSSTKTDSTKVTVTKTGSQTSTPAKKTSPNKKGTR